MKGGTVNTGAEEIEEQNTHPERHSDDDQLAINVDEERTAQGRDDYTECQGFLPSKPTFNHIRPELHAQISEEVGEKVRNETDEWAQVKSSVKHVKWILGSNGVRTIGPGHPPTVDTTMSHMARCRLPTVAP
jgi:hypothetical protein